MKDSESEPSAMDTETGSYKSRENREFINIQAPDTLGISDKNVQSGISNVIQGELNVAKANDVQKLLTH